MANWEEEIERARAARAESLRLAAEEATRTRDLATRAEREADAQRVREEREQKQRFAEVLRKTRALELLTRVKSEIWRGVGEIYQDPLKIMLVHGPYATSMVVHRWIGGDGGYDSQTTETVPGLSHITITPSFGTYVGDELHIEDGDIKGLPEYWFKKTPTIDDLFNKGKFSSYSRTPDKWTAIPFSDLASDSLEKTLLDSSMVRIIDGRLPAQLGSPIPASAFGRLSLRRMLGGRNS